MWRTVPQVIVEPAFLRAMLPVTRGGRRRRADASEAAIRDDRIRSSRAGAGATPCPAGLPTRCAGSASCTNLDDDPSNCGACGVSCVAGQACAAGQCVAGPMCGFDQACDPMCPPGADPDCGMPLPCSPGEFPCPAGMVCEPMMGVCIPG